MNNGKFVKNTKYYRDVVYEWNLPTGTTCPFALECKVVVDRVSGKFDISRGQYKCYAASPERFPAVRAHRWNNFEVVKSGVFPLIPNDCKSIVYIQLVTFLIKTILICGLNLLKIIPK
jgi:hypothetical protein